MSIVGIYSYLCAAFALAGALSVVIARNPIRSAMGLLLLILSVAGLFLPLNAQFLAAIQLIVYAGAIVVLFLFVIMLLGPVASPTMDRRGIVMRVFGGGLFALCGLGALAAVARAGMGTPRMPVPAVPATFGGINPIGSVLFSDALVPFELSSALLMVAVIGAVAVARGRQGIHSLTKAEREVAASAQTPSMSPTGIFSHEIPRFDHAAAGAADVPSLGEPLPGSASPKEHAS